MDLLATISEQEFDGDGEIPGGFLYASVKNVGTQDAQVNGVGLKPGEAKDYPFVGKGYHAIGYQAGGSVLRIMTIV